LAAARNDFFVTCAALPTSQPQAALPDGDPSLPRRMPRWQTSPTTISNCGLNTGATGQADIQDVPKQSTLAARITEPCAGSKQLLSHSCRRVHVQLALLGHGRPVAISCGTGGPTTGLKPAPPPANSCAFHHPRPIQGTPDSVAIKNYIFSHSSFSVWSKCGVNVGSGRVCGVSVE